MVAFISSCGGSSGSENKGSQTSPIILPSVVHIGGGETKEVSNLKVDSDLNFVRTKNLYPYKVMDTEGNSIRAQALATVASTYVDIKEKVGDSFAFGELFVDPFCMDGSALHGAYFAEIGKKKFICLSLTKNEKGKVYPLAFEPFVFAHELFHSLWVPLVQHGIYSGAVQISHELDSFNEGAADHFADVMTQNMPASWFFARLGMEWRNSLESDFIEPSYVYSDVNTDGQAYRRLLSELSNSGEDTIELLACTAKHINSDFLRALQADSSGYSYFYTNSDIHNALSTCVKNRDAFFSLLSKHFPKSLENFLEEAHINVIAIPTEDALCDVQKQMNLSMTDWVPGQLLDACGELSSFIEVGGVMKWARNQPSDNPDENNEPVFLLATWDGEQQGEYSDCRLVLSVSRVNGDWATERLLRSDEDHFPPFILKVPASFRGSHYRIQPMPHAKLESLVHLPWENVGILPLKNTKLNGFVLSQSFQNRPGDSLDNKYQRLADKLFSVFGQFQRDSVSQQNFEMECSSHLVPFSKENPLGDLKRIKNVVKNVFIHSCEEGGDNCNLRRYSR